MTVGLFVVLLLASAIAYLNTREEYILSKPILPKQTTKYTLKAALCIRFVKHLINYLLIAGFFHILTVLVIYGIKHF